MNASLKPMSLEEVKSSTRPIWIESIYHEMFSNWAVYDKAMAGGQLLRFEMIGHGGGVLFAVSDYGKGWAAFNNGPWETRR